MPERFRLKTIVSDVDTCINCPLTRFKGWVPNGVNWLGLETKRYDMTLYCQVAELEKSLGRVPTYNEVALELGISIDWPDRLPEVCRNEYKNFRDLPASDRK